MEETLHGSTTRAGRKTSTPKTVLARVEGATGSERAIGTRRWRVVKLREIDFHLERAAESATARSPTDPCRSSETTGSPSK